MKSTLLEVDMVCRAHLDVNRKFQSPTNECRGDFAGNTVYLIDDDLAALEALSALLRSDSRIVFCFKSAAEYLEHGKSGEASCLIINMHLRDQSGLDLQRKTAREMGPSVIFITDQPDISAAVLAMKAGAIQVLAKPVNQSVLIEAVSEALVQDRKRRLRNAEVAKLQQRLSLLTPREREVLPLIVAVYLKSKPPQYSESQR